MLRRRQRGLAKDIQESGAEIEDSTKKAFTEKRGKNNELFESVFYAREAALDGENMATIAERASKQANKVSWKVGGRRRGGEMLMWM